MQKTYAEIIDETLAAGYTLTNRATRVGSEFCYYIHPETGIACAVGRCCEAPQSDWHGGWTTLAASSRAPMFEPQEREALLKPEYRGHSAYFWLDLQGLHDSDFYWDESGLSKDGEQEVFRIQAKWCQHDSTN